MESSRSFFIYLAGDRPELAISEVETLLKLGGCTKYGFIAPRILKVTPTLDTVGLLRRAALVKYAGQIIFKIEDIDSSTVSRVPWPEITDSKAFIVAVDRSTVPGAELVARMMVETISSRQPNFRFQPSKANKILHVFKGADGFYICVSERPPRRRWIDRRPRARAFFHPTALHPRLARCLVNLTAASPGEVLLDPFCGTGSILIEAGYIGIKPLGIDLSRAMVRGASSNVKQFGIENAEVVLGDGICPPCKRVASVATDLPYGRGSKTMGRTPNEIANMFLKSVSQILPPARRCVVLHAKGLPIEHDAFKLLFAHEIPVHRNLTRVVSVLELN